MPKNIILCADGTGNRGGYTPDSNVYKIYNAIEIHDTGHPQIKFYDNGVGTAKNSYWKAISGAFGFGFGENVCELYQYLCRNYEAGDQVYLFGFSRGAATVRALSGFIAACGLVKDKDPNGEELEADALQDRVAAAFKAYQSASKDQPPAAPSATSHGAVPITCIGVWDTVSALGWPQDWKIKGVGVLLLNGLLKLLDTLSECIPRTRHRFYNYELTPNVKAAYQALAIDDERKTFKPMVWDETQVGEGTEIEQVWFAGVHSNVGGGYERAGLAGVTLDWMMTRVSQHGLLLEAGAHEVVTRDADVHGQLYNSRDGLAIFYRYQPREITELCQDDAGKTKLRRDVTIHHSVLERMQRRTANYAPGHFPSTFNVIGTAAGSPRQSVTVTDNVVTWNKLCGDVQRWVARRKALHSILIEFTFFFVLLSGYFWLYPLPKGGDLSKAATALSLNWWTGHLADFLDYILPVFFEGLVNVIVRCYPIMFVIVVVFLITIWRLRSRFQSNNIKACEAIRKAVMASSASH